MAKKKLGAVEPLEAAVTGQELDTREKDLVTEVYTRLEVFMDGCKEMHDRSKVARQIILLQDPYQDAVAVDDVTGLAVTDETVPPTLQLATLKSTYNHCVADQMDNFPEARMLPERNGLEQQAEDATDIVRFILANNNFDGVYRRVVEDFIGTGSLVYQAAWDSDLFFGKGDIAVLRWPIEAFLWDPQCENLQDSRAVMKVSWHPLSWYVARYPKIAKFVSEEESKHEGVGVPLSQETAIAGDEPRAMMIEYWYRLYNAETRKYSINVAYLAGGALLEHHEKVYNHGLYPFVMCAHTPIEGSPSGDGMVQEMAPVMRYINKYAKYIDTNLRMSSKARMLVKRGSGIDKEALADYDQDIIESDNIDPDSFHWLEHPQFNGMIANQMLQFQTDLKMDSGQNQFQRGETVGGVTAKGAFEALIESGSKITRLRTATLNAGFKQLVEQILWLMAQFYTDERVRLITGVDGKPREVDFNIFKDMDGTQPPPFTVQIQVQRRDPLKIQAQNDLFIQAYTMSAQSGQIFPLSALFELLNVDGKERILPVLRETEKFTEQMTDLAKQVESLTAQNEELSKGLSNLQGLNAKMMKNQPTQQATANTAMMEGNK